MVNHCRWIAKSKPTWRKLPRTCRSHHQDRSLADHLLGTGRGTTSCTDLQQAAAAVLETQGQCSGVTRCLAKTGVGWLASLRKWSDLQCQHQVHVLKVLRSESSQFQWEDRTFERISRGLKSLTKSLCNWECSAVNPRKTNTCWWISSIYIYTYNIIYNYGI